ncbi:G patch domain-containing protein 2 [Biomphalaria pfeifferi]|uniref:G patch domain-containing protein 2 n=1 Tax=Biomphalaria pfeifferi TaxID=112525 RepID=A0AAD8BE87_BIOPF|nr:G patch domain-containing protein 2 [Biomphalaria pfeifferi]
MDELVQDLTTALEETANVGRPGTLQAEGANSSTYPRRCMKKRRGLRRPASSSYYWKRGTISEASESSVDEHPRRDYAGNVIHSDSDDLAACHRIPKLTVPLVDPIPPVESDSFTENFSPLRPQRRRRKYKTMAVDSSPLTDQFPSDADSASGDKQCGKRKEELPLTCEKSIYPSFRSTPSYVSHAVTAGKRKRSSKSRVDYSYCSQPEFSAQGMTSSMDRMEVASVSQESSLSSSEFDSDLNVNNEDTREADDEQSDFFHEPGPACGIPDIVPWWENERTGREFRLGRRKLKGKMPRYTVGKFLQDREHWNRMQSHHANSQVPGSAACSNINNSNSHGGEFKRRRHVTRSAASIDGMNGQCSDSVQESSSGLAPKVSRSNGSGSIKSPVTAVRKNIRKNSANYSVSDS